MNQGIARGDLIAPGKGIRMSSAGNMKIVNMVCIVAGASPSNVKAKEEMAQAAHAIINVKVGTAILIGDGNAEDISLYKS